MNDKVNKWFPVIIAFLISIGMLGYVLWNGFVFAPKQMDMILESLETNQTHVDSLKCEDIELAIASGHQMMLLNKPVKLIDKLKEIAKDKECQFKRPDLWLDGYEPNNERVEP